MNNIESEKIDNEGLNNLCAGIAKQAADDYRIYATEYYELKSKYNENRSRCLFLQGQMNAIERFFTSPYGNLICHNCGDYIIRRIKSDIQQHN